MARLARWPPGLGSHRSAAVSLLRVRWPQAPGSRRSLLSLLRVRWDGDPGQRGGGTTIIVNAPAVSGQEVVEAIGKYVDGNGPLPPHWQQGAN